MSGGAWAAEPYLPMDGYKLVTASAVRMRAAPELAAPVTGYLKLGGTVHASQRTREERLAGAQKGYWYRVREGRRQGWVFGQFLRDFTPATQESLWLGLARERANNSKLSFADYADVYGFVSSILPKVRNPAVGLELEFNRLIALQRSLDAIPLEQAGKPPYSRWLAARQKEVFLDEISARWLVHVDAYWKLAERAKAFPIGDEIAWYAARAPLGGECEGDVACNLQRLLMTEGEYLRLYPQGRHAGEAFKEAHAVLGYMEKELKQQPDYFRGDRDSGKVLDKLLEIAQRARGEGVGEVLKQLQAVRASYLKMH